MLFIALSQFSPLENKLIMIYVMKSKLNLSVSYYTRNNKQSEGDSPVMLRVSLNGKRSSFGQIGMELKPIYLKKNRVTSKHPNAKELNKRLIDLENRIFFLAEHLFSKGQLSLLSIKEELNGKKKSQQYVSAIFDELINEKEQELQAGKIVVGSVNRYHNFARVFMSFIAYKYHRNDLRIQEITKDIIREYEAYLHSVLGYSHNTLIKYMRFLIKTTRRGIELGLIDQDPFKGISYQDKETDRGFLDEKEVALLIKTPIVDEHLSFIRDTFIFACFTGLSYSDVANLTSNNLCSFNGEKWILIRRQKTDVSSKIPLLPQAQEILEKYKDYETSDGRLLPLPCNQVINRHLKQIQAICGIEKKLTFHMARHSFATLALCKGVSIETVGQVLGHKWLKTTQIYAKVLPSKVAAEMNQMANRLQNERCFI